jgi:leucyl-tRNA synthetase
MGNAFSWNMSTSSTDPEYYKWTQWMFTEFFKNDIAYRGKGIVNWCPGCNTVIANEQVLTNGTCERSGDHIEKREMKQWMLRITNYADRLIDDLNALDWPEHIKEAQRQWIGRSKGAEIPFALSTGEMLSVFTTRPDTLFGATYLVLAPEHELVQKNMTVIANWSEVESYSKEASQKDEVLRTKVEKEKTGVLLQGITAKNPATGDVIPVYIADYVLKGYGTGAIMAVPAHDERDFAFATKFSIPIQKVISGDEQLPFANHGTLVDSDEFNGMDSEEAKEAITKKVGGKLTNTYRLRDWSIGRQRYWGVPIPIVYDLEGNAHAIPKEHLPWHLPTDVDFTPTGEAPLAKSKELKARTEKIFGVGWTPEVETMDTFVDSSWYFLRYFDTRNDKEISSLEKQKQWMPIDIYFGGAEHTTMHLLYSRFWQKALFDLGYVTLSEPYKKRINRGLVLGPDGNKMSKSKGNVIDPDIQVRSLGADTVKMYLAFMGPYGESTNYPWDMGGIAGIRRFLERVHGLAEHIIDSDSLETEQLFAKTIAKVTSDIRAYKFNTAISALMVLINHVEKHGLTKESYEVFLLLLAPFAPHLTEELWSLLDNRFSIHESTWPVANASLLLDEIIMLSVQINGKMRGTVSVSPDASESTVLEVVKNDLVLKSKIQGEIVKVIYVPKRIINIVLQTPP